MNVNLIYKQTGYSFQITQFTALSFIYEVTNKVFRIPIGSFKLFYKEQYIPNTQSQVSDYFKKFPIIINVLENKKPNHQNEKSKTNEELVFDIKGIDPTIVNTLRRIMIAEIPTMAIETVIINQNTSIIPDEVLAHRLGLIPILADANDFIEKKPEEDFNEQNSMKFTLNVKCFTDNNGKIINR